MLYAAPVTLPYEMQVAEPLMQRVTKRTIKVAVESEAAGIHRASGKNRDDSHGSAGSSFDLDGQCDEDRPFRR